MLAIGGTPMTIEQWGNEVGTIDALAYLFELRPPLIIGDLNFGKGTWEDLPVNPYLSEKLAEIAESLTERERLLVKMAYLLIRWGRGYEYRRLMWGDDDDTA